MTTDDCVRLRSIVEHLAKKCIWALGAIGSAEAIQARDAATVGALEVRAATTFELAQIDDQPR